MINDRNETNNCEQETDGCKPSALSELLYCPFCGAGAEIVTKKPMLPTGKRDTLYIIRCRLRECGVETLAWYPMGAAIASWNRRAT